MKVYDLNKYIIPDDMKTMWVDTNILLWYFYYPTVNINIPRTYQLAIYPNIFKILLLNKCKIYTTIYNISETIAVVEKIEYENYLIKNKKEKSKYKFKKFKSDNIKNLHTIISNILIQINHIIKIESPIIEFNKINDYLSIYTNTTMGFFDFILSNSINDKNFALMTDDCDFLFEQFKLNVYTANNTFLQNAKKLNVLHDTQQVQES